jgi:hypothetical protein
MWDFKARAEALGKTEEEIRAEMAASLGRIGRKLEEILFELALVQRSLESADGPCCEETAERFCTLRESARRHLWYLTVQREAMGMRNHEDLERVYPIPGPLHRRQDKER